MDSKEMHFSLIALAQMVTRVDEHAIITRKGIKDIASLIVQGCLHSDMTNGPEAEEMIKVNDKWTT